MGLSYDQSDLNLYLGNLPRSKTLADDLHAHLWHLGVKVAPEALRVSVKGHAYAIVPDVHAAIVAVDGTCLGGRPVVAQIYGQSEMQQLRATLEDIPRACFTEWGASWELPSGEIIQVTRDDGATKGLTLEKLARETRRFLGGEDWAAKMATLQAVTTVDKAAAVVNDTATEQAEAEAVIASEAADAEAEAEAVAEVLATTSIHMRNMCIIAHVDHGKTTLSDTLLSASGLLSSHSAGSRRVLDTGLEAERGITIYSSAVTLPFPQQSLQLTLIDCPGHAEFGSEVSAALRLTDGALLLVDASEGVCVQTEACLRQALREGVKPVLVLNKLDRLLPEPEPATAAQDGGGDGSGDGGGGPVVIIADAALERALGKMRGAVAQVNAIIASHNASRDAAHGEPLASPVALEDGTVCFGSAKEGWLTTLRQFAVLHSRRRAEAQGGTDAAGRASLEQKAMEALTDPSKHRVDDNVKKMILHPLAVLHALAGAGKADVIDRRLRAIGGPAMALTTQERGLADPKALCRATFHKLVPAAETLLDMIKAHLPSPQAALAVRAQVLLGGRSAGGVVDGSSGGEGDEGGSEVSWERVLSASDPSGPLFLYVAKHQKLPGSGRTGAAAVCRVLSGTVSVGQDVFVLPEGSSGGGGGGGGTAAKARVSRLLKLTPTGPSGSVPHASAGSIVALLGLEKVLLRCGSVSSDASAPALATMPFTLTPVEFRAVSATKAGPSVARRLAEALRELPRSDPLVRAYYDRETEEHVVAAAGELHMEVSLVKLRELMGASEGEKLSVSQARFAHRESVSGATPRTPARPGALGKSANKLNRLWMVASPLAVEVVEAIETGAIHAGMPVEKRSQALIELPVAKSGEVGGEAAAAVVPWEKKDARRILAFGPDGTGANLLVDSTFGVQGIDTVKDHLIAAFQQLCAKGPLANEQLRGVRFDLVDAKVHGEGAQKGFNEMMPAARRAMEAAMLGACPTIQEQLMHVTFSAPLGLVGEAYQELSQRRAVDTTHMVADAQAHGSEAICTVSGLLPLVESPGLTEALRGRMSGHGSSLRLDFAGWSTRDGAAWLVDGAEAAAVVQGLRKHKGLGIGPQEWQKVADRL